MVYMEKQKVRIEVELINKYSYYAEPMNYYDDGLRNIYIFRDDNGDIFVWKTSKVLGEEGTDERGFDYFRHINVGAKLFIGGTVKANSNYKGEPQVVLTRCNIMHIYDFGYSEEELEEIRKKAQLDSITILDKKIRVTYKEYKEKYPSCEKVIGSFERTPSGCFIEIIVRG